MKTREEIVDKNRISSSDGAEPILAPHLPQSRRLTGLLEVTKLITCGV